MDPVTRAMMEEFAAACGIEDFPDNKKFEHFAAYCIVSSRYNEEFDTSDLVSGEGQDLNVDAFAIKVNGRIANDAQFIEDILATNGYLEVEIIVVQAKTSSSFDGAALIAHAWLAEPVSVSDVRGLIGSVSARALQWIQNAELMSLGPVAPAADATARGGRAFASAVADERDFVRLVQRAWRDNLELTGLVNAGSVLETVFPGRSKLAFAKFTISVGEMVSSTPSTKPVSPKAERENAMHFSLAA